MGSHSADGRTGRGSRIFYHDRFLCEKIRKMYEDEGMSLERIAAKLKEDGVTTPYGGGWNWETIKGAIVQAGGTIRSRSQAQINYNHRRTKSGLRSVVPKG